MKPVLFALILGLCVHGLATAMPPVQPPEDPDPPVADVLTLPPVAPPVLDSSNEGNPLLRRALELDVPEWCQPGCWYRSWRDAWEASFQLGLNGGHGNADAFSINTGADMKRDTERFDHAYGISYAQSSAGSRTTQALFNVDARTDWKVADSPWSTFCRENLLHDRLQTFDWRLALNAGVGYQWIKTAVVRFKTRLGSGTSKEFGGPDQEWIPEANAGFDFGLHVTKKQKFTAEADYFPDWSDFRDFRVTAKAGWEFILDAEPNLSLKLQAVNRYDSTPNNLRANDLNYQMLLLWKL